MAASVMLSSVTLKPAGFTRARPSFKIVASGVKKIKTDKPFGLNGSMAKKKKTFIFSSRRLSSSISSRFYFCVIPKIGNQNQTSLSY
jgi:hypothetical protein